jgi:hypothetical protein
MGDALRYTTLFIRLTADIGGEHRDAESCLAIIKMTQAEGRARDRLLDRLLDAADTTAGLCARWKALLRDSGAMNAA